MFVRLDLNELERFTKSEVVKTTDSRSGEFARHYVGVRTANRGKHPPPRRQLYSARVSVQDESAYVSTTREY
ncbi:hypothetical protein JCM13591A_15970 [Microbacterium xylanilyticum]